MPYNREVEEVRLFVEFSIIGERDTIRGVQIRAGAVYIYIYMEVRVTNSSTCYAYVM